MYETQINQLPEGKAPTFASSAMLLDVHISMYSGRKTDRKTQDEVTVAKGAGSKRASSVYKHLFADDADLEAINRYQARCRRGVEDLTLPWADSGTRMVTTAAFFDVSRELTVMRTEFDRLVALFLTNYTAKISNAAFRLGALFDRNDFPVVDEIKHKFRFHYVFSPVPTAGDFRVDLHQSAVTMLRDHYSKVANERVQAAVDDVWGRVFEKVSHLRGKLGAQDESRKRRTPIYETTLENIKELARRLDGLNLTGDPAMTEAGEMMREAVDGVDIDSLRESDEVRDSVRSKMDAIINKFSLGE